MFPFPAPIVGKHILYLVKEYVLLLLLLIGFPVAGDSNLAPSLVSVFAGTDSSVWLSWEKPLAGGIVSGELSRLISHHKHLLILPSPLITSTCSPRHHLSSQAPAHPAITSHLQAPANSAPTSLMSQLPFVSEAPANVI